MALALISPLSACGFYPLGDEGHSPSATEEQVREFLAICQITDAKVERGKEEGETDWVIGLGGVSQDQQDCLREQKEQAGVIATTWKMKAREAQ